MLSRIRPQSMDELVHANFVNLTSVRSTSESRSEFVSLVENLAGRSGASANQLVGAARSEDPKSGSISGVSNTRPIEEIKRKGKKTPLANARSEPREISISISPSQM